MSEDNQRRRAEDAEAMYLGAVMGGAENVAKLRSNLKATKDILAEEVAYHINSKASAAAYKRLSEAIVKELKDPDLPRRFSDPGNPESRALLLEIAHNKEIKRIRNLEKENGYTPTELEVEVLERLTKKSIQSYRELKI